MMCSSLLSIRNVFGSAIGVKKRLKKKTYLITTTSWDRTLTTMVIYPSVAGTALSSVIWVILGT